MVDGTADKERGRFNMNRQLYSTQRAADDYKTKYIKASRQKETEDEYYTAKLLVKYNLSGEEHERYLDIDDTAMKILQAYYEGKHIVIEERHKIKL